MILDVYTSYISDKLSNLNEENRVGLISGTIYLFYYNIGNNYFFVSDDCGDSFYIVKEFGPGGDLETLGGGFTLEDVRHRISTYDNFVNNRQQTLELLEKAIEDCDKE